MQRVATALTSPMEGSSTMSHLAVPGISGRHAAASVAGEETSEHAPDISQDGMVVLDDATLASLEDVTSASWAVQSSKILPVAWSAAMRLCSEVRNVVGRKGGCRMRLFCGFPCCGGWLYIRPNQMAHSYHSYSSVINSDPPPPLHHRIPAAYGFFPSFSFLLPRCVSGPPSFLLSLCVAVRRCASLCVAVRRCASVAVRRSLCVGRCASLCVAVLRSEAQELEGSHQRYAMPASAAHNIRIFKLSDPYCVTCAAAA